MSRVDMEKFDGKINFGLWQVQVKDVLKQSGSQKDLNGARLANGSDSDVSIVSSFMGDGNVA